MSLAARDLIIQRGYCYAAYSYDIGLGIDLEQCSQIITVSTERTRLQRTQRAPTYFQYDPPPLRISQPGAEFRLSEHLVNAHAEITLFDFGAVTVVYTIDIRGPFSQLVTLSKELYDNQEILNDSRRRVQELIGTIAKAVSRLRILQMVEEYNTFHIEEFATPVALHNFCDEYPLEVSQVLRSESDLLSDEEIRDALSYQLSYTPHDRVVIDWNAAFVFGPGGDDIRAVLEFGNVELLEMRFLDERLDDDLEASYQALLLGKSSKADLHRIGQLQVDAAVLFEAVNNALKLLGDQYLARVYALVSKRFHLADWDSSILRKLNTLESIYQKLSDRAAQRRTEVLEIIIIGLIIVEIILSFVH